MSSGKLCQWKQYLNVKRAVLKIPSMFGSTYVCESVFSTLKHVKSKHRYVLMDTHVKELLRVATTEYKPDLKRIIQGKECHKSHQAACIVRDKHNWTCYIFVCGLGGTESLCVWDSAHNVHCWKWPACGLSNVGVHFIHFCLLRCLHTLWNFFIMKFKYFRFFQFNLLHQTAADVFLLSHCQRCWTEIFTFTV